MIPNQYKQTKDHRQLSEWSNETKTKTEVNKMTTIKEQAQAYEPKHTKNIADLDKVDVNMNIEDREGIDKDQKVFKYKVAVIDGEDYRIPGVVLGDLKEILAKKPDLKLFSVTKKGEGTATRYTVIPIE